MASYNLIEVTEITGIAVSTAFNQIGYSGHLQKILPV